jgi:hypothetical protein
MAAKKKLSPAQRDMLARMETKPVWVDGASNERQIALALLSRNKAVIIHQQPDGTLALGLPGKVYAEE